MSFLELFLPILAALCSWTVFVEILSVSIQFLVNRRQSAAYKDLQDKIARGEIPPGYSQIDMDPAMLANLFGGGSRVLPEPTTSGQSEQHSGGQYL